MNADGVRCYFCHEPIGPLEAMSRRVVGWERVRGGGGGNGLTDRMEFGQNFAHTHCAMRRGDERRRGIAPTQGQMM